MSIRKEVSDDWDYLDSFAEYSCPDCWEDLWDCKCYVDPYCTCGSGERILECECWKEELRKQW